MDNFLNELWSRKTEHEHEGDDSDDLASPEMELERYERTDGVKTYKIIREQAGYDEITQELFEELKRGILNYYSTIIRLEKTSIISDDKDAVEQADGARRFAHNSIIGNLDALSRYIGKHGLDNEWRRVIGLERTQVTNWVKEVAPYIVLTS